MDVFLSYNRRDSRHAEVLNDWLGGQGIATFFDHRDLGAGQLWLPDLERRIEHETHAVAVLVGSGGLGNTQQYEYQLALTRQAAEPGFPVIPVILPGTPDWRVPRGFLGLQTWISFAAAVDPREDPAGLQRLAAAIRRETAGSSDTVRGGICPFKGLGFFEEADAAVFFGRDSEADALLSTLAEQRVAALIGRSGSGKSSLVRAGLLPRLRRPGCAGVWDNLVIRPGEEPLVALADALSPARQEDPLDRRRRLERQAEMLRTDKPDILAGTLRQHMGAARLHVDRLLIVVDQAEELFSQPWRLTDGAAIRQFHADAEQFIRLLLEAAMQGSASVVLTIRSDFFDQLMHSPFAPVLKDTLVQLGRMADLHPCIERPAELVGLRFAPGLADRIVDEVGPEESNLPLLQHALERTWQRRSGPLLSSDAYTAAGGVAQAINQAARDCYESLSASERAAARRLFLRLVRPGEGSAHVRIRAAVPDDPEERHVMEAFAHPDRRLLFVGDRAGVPVVEVAHEALVRGWDALRQWVEDSREKLRVRDAVTDWRASAADGELIPPGSALLQRAADLLADPGDVRLDRGLEEYIRRSVGAAQAASAAAHRQRRRLFAGAVAAAVVFAVLSVASGWFWLQSEKHRALADEQRRVAETQREIAEEQRKSAEEQRRSAEEQRALAEVQRRSAEAQRARAETSAKVARDAAERLIFDIAQGLGDQQGISVGTVQHVLDTASGVIDAMLRFNPDDPGLLRLKAVALDDFADTYARIGKTDRQLQAVNEALAIFRSLVSAKPDDTSRQLDLSYGDERLGDALVAQGKLPAALAAYREEFDVQQRLIDREPNSAAFQRSIFVTHGRIGEVLTAQGNLSGALDEFRQGLAIMTRVAERDPGRTDWQRDLSVANEKLGNALSAQGNLAGALEVYRASLAITEKLAARDPNNSEWQRDLSVSQEKMGNVLQAQGELAASLEAYRKCLAIRETLAARDPDNTQWKRDVSVGHSKIGGVLLAQHDLPGALAAFRKDLAIAEALAARDPANTEWQRDLSVSYSTVADVLKAQGDLSGALDAYQKSLAIREKLVVLDAANTDWQADLSVSLDKIGDVLDSQSEFPRALAVHRKALAIIDGLVVRDPGNTEWQRDLSISLSRVAETLLRMDRRDEARALAQRALTTRRSAIQRISGDPRLTSGLRYYEDLLRRAGGDPARQ